MKSLYPMYGWMVYAKAGLIGSGGYAFAWVELEAGEGMQGREGGLWIYIQLIIGEWVI